MAAATDPTDPAEPDLYWAGHSGWAMLPGLVIGGAVSAVIMLGAPPVAGWVNLAPDVTAFICFWLVLIGWGMAGLVWAYRGASYVYRLTPKHLYVDFGMMHRPVPAIPLSDVEAVEHMAWRLRRWFGVGAVVIHVRGRDPVRLRGVFRPVRLARAIRTAVRVARRS